MTNLDKEHLREIYKTIRFVGLLMFIYMVIDHVGQLIQRIVR